MITYGPRGVSTSTTPIIGTVLLRTEGLVAGYVPEVDILDGVDLELREGEVVTIVCPNGAGKSTLIKTVFGLLRPRAGRIVLREAEIGMLIRSRLLAADSRHDNTAVLRAFYRFLDDTLR